MDIGSNFGRISARPLLLLVALFCALAIGLAGYLALRTQQETVQTGVTQAFPFYQDRPGPDAPSRNHTQPAPTADPWANHGT